MNTAVSDVNCEVWVKGLFYFQKKRTDMSIFCYTVHVIRVPAQT